MHREYRSMTESVLLVDDDGKAYNAIYTGTVFRVYPDIGSPGDWIPSRGEWRTSDGELLNGLGDGSFEIATTGKCLRRVKGAAPT